MGKEIFTNDKYINDLFLKVVNLVTQARERVATAVNLAEVYTKFHIRLLFPPFAHILLYIVRYGT